MKEDFTGYIDLHTHSTCSDGTLTPTELVHRAKECGLAAIALTDHDTVAGLPEAVTAGADRGVEVVPGIELSARFDGELHILGYFIDYKDEGLRRTLREQVRSRNARNLKMLDRLGELGIRIGREELPDPSGASVTRAHIAVALVKRGYASSIREAFSRYLVKGSPAYVPRQRPTAAECIHTIRSAGGQAYLAHLNQLRLADEPLLELVKELRGLGLSGIEGLYSEYDEEWTRKCRRIAASLDLKLSGGSDFHGANKDIRLGVGYGQLRIPYSVLEAMRKIPGC